MRGVLWGVVLVWIAGCGGPRPASSTAPPAVVSPPREAGHELGEPVLLAVSQQDSCVQLRGERRCWGDGSTGALGTGLLWPEREPVPLSLLGDERSVRALGLGKHGGCAATHGGQVVCWGMGNGGVARQPSGVEPDPTVKAAVMVGVAGAEAVTLGDEHGCALDAEGVVWCWGKPQRLGAGPQGDGDELPPRRVEGLPRIVQLASNNQATCARSWAGALWCWGGQEREGVCDHPSCSPVPERVSQRVLHVTMGALDCALHDDRARCWAADGDRFDVIVPPATRAVEASWERLCALSQRGDLACTRWASCLKTGASLCRPRFELLASDVIAVALAGDRGLVLRRPRDGADEVELLQWEGSPGASESSQPEPVPWRPGEAIEQERAGARQAFLRQRAEARTVMDVAHVLIAAAPTPKDRRESLIELALAETRGGDLAELDRYPDVEGMGGAALAEALADAGDCSRASTRMVHAWMTGADPSWKVMRQCPSAPALERVETWLRRYSAVSEMWAAVGRGWHWQGNAVRRDAALARAQAQLGIPVYSSDKAVFVVSDTTALAVALLTTGAQGQAQHLIEQALAEVRKAPRDPPLYELGWMGKELRGVGELNGAAAVVATLEALGQGAPDAYWRAHAFALGARLAVSLGRDTDARRLALAAQQAHGKGQRDPATLVVETWVALGDLAQARTVSLQEPAACSAYALAQAKRGDAQAVLEVMVPWVTAFTPPIIEQVTAAFLDRGSCDKAGQVLSKLDRPSYGWVLLAEQCPASHPVVLDHLRPLASRGGWWNVWRNDDTRYPVIEALCVTGHYAAALRALGSSHDYHSRVGALARLAVVQRRRGDSLDPEAQEALMALLNLADYLR